MFRRIVQPAHTPLTHPPHTHTHPPDTAVPLLAVVRGIAQRAQHIVVQRAATGGHDAAHVRAQLRAAREVERFPVEVGHAAARLLNEQRT